MELFPTLYSDTKYLILYTFLWSMLLGHGAGNSIRIKGREGKGREGKRREEKGREEKGREGK